MPKIFDSASVHRHRLAGLAGRADQRAELELELEPLRRAVHRPVVAAAPDLALGPAEALPARADRRGAPVVRDRHPLVVRQQRVLGPVELADGGGVVDAGVEVGELADAARQRHLGHRLRQQAQLEEGPQLAVLGERDRQRVPQHAPRARAERHEGIELAGRQRREQLLDLLGPGALRARQVEVEDLVADGHADAPRVAAALAPEAAVGQVLQREVAQPAVGRRHPAAQRRVVRRVEQRVDRRLRVLRVERQGGLEIGLARGLVSAHRSARRRSGHAVRCRRTRETVRQSCSRS